MEPKNPRWRARLDESLAAAPFVHHLGMRFLTTAPGHIVTELDIRPELTQHTGSVHAGVMTSLADHTAGAAAASLAGEEDVLLSVEFKVNNLRPAVGELLRCEASVIKPGRTLTIVRAEVYAVTGEAKVHCQTFLGTMIVLPKGR